MTRTWDGSVRVRIAFVVAASALLLATSGPVFAGNGTGAQQNKQFNANICTLGQTACVGSPPSVSTDPSGVDLTFTVTNESNQQSLGSTQVTAPSGFTISDSVTPTCTTNSGPCLNTVSGNTLQYNYLGIVKVGAGTPISFSATIHVVAVNSGCGTNAWTVGAHQANQYNSATGNDFYINLAHSQLSTPVAGAVCALRFTSDGQPGAVQQVNTALTSSSGPIKVEGVDASGNRVTTFNGNVSIALGCTTVGPPDDTGAALGGTTTQQASSGVASFGDLTVNLSNPLSPPYCLTASWSGLSVQSSGFHVYDLACNTATCDVNSSDGHQEVLFSSGGNPSGVSFDPSGVGTNLNCNDQYLHADHTTFIFIPAFSGSEFDFTIRIPKAFVKTNGTPGSGQYEACIASHKQFKTITGALATPTVFGNETLYVGIVPNCSPKPKPDCAHIYKNNGDLIQDIFLDSDVMHK